MGQCLLTRPQQLLGRGLPEGVLHAGRAQPGDGVELGIAERHRERQMARAQRGDVCHQRLGREAVGQLLAATAIDPLVQRDVAMIELVYASGLRVSEIVALTVSHVKLEAGYLTVIGKGRKERAVPIGRLARTRLLAYLKDVRPQILGRRLSASTTGVLSCSVMP